MSAPAVALAVVVGGAVGAVAAPPPEPAADAGPPAPDAMAALRRAVDAQQMATGGAVTLRAILRGELPGGGDSFPPRDW